MALRALPIESMVTVVGAWVTPKRDRPIVELYPKLAPFLPDLDELHNALLSAGEDDRPDIAKELKRIRSKARALDDRHDTVVRGIDDVLAGLVHLAKEEATKTALAGLRETLFPDGRRVVNWSFRRQGGAAERAHSRLSAAQKKALKEMAIPGGTLLAFHNERLNLARQIVELDRQRLALKGTLDADRDAKPVGVYRAELSFVRIVGLFVANLEASVLSANHRAQLMGGLEAALENAHQRRSNSQTDGALEEGPTDLEDSAGAPPAVVVARLV